VQYFFLEVDLHVDKELRPKYISLDAYIASCDTPYGGTYGRK